MRIGHELNHNAWVIAVQLKQVLKADDPSLAIVLQNPGLHQSVEDVLDGNAQIVGVTTARLDVVGRPHPDREAHGC